MSSKRFLLGFVLFAFLLALPLLLSVSSFSQEPYTFVLKWGGTGQGDGQFDNWRYGDFACFRGVAVDSEDNVYVVDGGNRRVQKFNKDGGFLRKWGDEGTEDGQFLSAMGIAIDKTENGDFVYVTDNSSNFPYWHPSRVQKFDTDGNFLKAWSSPVFNGNAIGIDIDKGGNIYLVTDGYPVIKKYSRDMQAYLGGFGHGTGDPADQYGFSYPEDIAVNNNGDIYITVWGEGVYPSQVKKFNSSFEYQKAWLLERILAIAIDSQQNVLVGSRDGSPDMGLYKYDPDGNLIQRIAPTGYGDGQISWPQGIAVDSEGSVYVYDCLRDNLSDQDNNRVQKFAPPYVPYTFEGFFSPIENTPTVNKANAGQAIPVKWRITDKNGLPISDPASFINITSYGVNCAAFAGDPTSIVVEELAAGSSGLQYLDNGWWQFNWKTSKTYKGLCRVMKLTLDDKSEHTASFSFK